MTAKPKVVIIGTGGTIAGRAASATDLAYDAAQLSVDELLVAIPGLKDIADISATNLFALNSKDMGPGEWLQLARRIETCAEDQDTTGVVVTHGTDTLEEAALFLELTLRTQKPVVITGSMRAATALSADGPANLYHAVQVSASSQAIGRGVLVVLNGEIFSGIRVIKGHSIATNAFSASAGGLIGNAYSGHTFFFVPPGFSPLHGAFHRVLQNDQALPQVGVHYITAGGNEQALVSLEAAGCQGLVLAAFGSGEIPEALVPGAQAIAERGTPIVVSSRVNHAVVLPETMTLNEGGNVVASRHFNPQKSAILLTLTLATGSDPRDVFARADIAE